MFLIKKKSVIQKNIYQNSKTRNLKYYLIKFEHDWSIQTVQANRIYNFCNEKLKKKQCLKGLFWHKTDSRETQHLFSIQSTHFGSERQRS